MRGAPVRSFGRPEPEPEPQQGPVILPPVVLPSVHLPVVLVVDVESLRDAAGQIQAMVAQAVRDGFVEALADHDPDRGGRAPFVPDAPEPAQIF